ncbi:MAG: hypothetical protein JXX28_17145 [Deltaproteobacteria bacterium]|nr:hypothetical protein [Deltaproteobacteria bacterium]
MSSHPLHALLDQLHALTGEQLEAARRLDGARLTELNDQRTALNFELQLALETEVPEDERAHLAHRARELAGLERRLHGVASTVVEALDAAIPTRPPPVYGRTGRIDKR